MEAQFISVLSKNDIKEAVIEALAETKGTPKTTGEGSKTIYGLKGLAAFLGIGVVTAWKLKKSGKIPYYQSGKKFFFKEDEILKATIKR